MQYSTISCLNFVLAGADQTDSVSEGTADQEGSRDT